MRTITAGVASETAYELAEGPVWDADRERLLWVDIPHGKVLCGRLVSGGVQVTDEYEFSGPAAAVVPTADGGLLVALRRGFAAIAADGTAWTGRRSACRPARAWPRSGRRRAACPRWSSAG